ncbi:MAG: bacterial proteasome activator family protein [Microthrixaceae bacterium]
MSDTPTDTSTTEEPALVPAVVHEPDSPTEFVESPGKVMRIGSMIKQLLEEVRQSDLDEPSRERLREIYETSVTELASALSPDLQDELKRLAHPFDTPAVPSEAELRIAKAQLVGWLEGLFHGIQATLFAQQVAARQQLEQMQGRALPPGAAQMMPGEVEGGRRADDPRPGTYL